MIFSKHELNITTEGKRHLGAAIGQPTFCEEYVLEKVNTWCNEMKRLCLFAKSQPQAALAAFIQGQQHKYTYFLKNIPEIKEHLQPLDDILSYEFSPTIFGSEISAEQRELFSLPIRLGGLGIKNLTDIAQFEYDVSKQVTAPLATVIVLQANDLPDPEATEKKIHDLKKTKKKSQHMYVSRIRSRLTPETARAVDLAAEKRHPAGSLAFH